MRRRILSLALAGTTAFSVFGAALTANAASSTHVTYADDAYVSYTPAEKIVVTSAETSTTYTYIDYNNPTAGIMDESTLETYLKSVAVQDNYVGYYTVGDYYLSKDFTTVSDGGEDETTYTVSSLSSSELESMLGITTSTSPSGTTLYTYSGITGTLTEALTALANASTLTYYAKNGSESWDEKGSEASNITSGVYDALPTLTAYKSSYIRTASSDTSTTGTNSVTVDGVDYTKWDFDATIDDPMDTDVENGTVYLYDFYYLSYFKGDAEDIEDAWKDGDTDDLVAAFGAGTYTFESGSGSYYSARHDVISDWVDFLDELAINADNGYYETYAQFVKNYTDMFYDDPIYDIHSGKLVDTEEVDLYNITQLLEDIYELNNEDDYEDVNTSQLVYLMQQYDKYIGTYIDIDDSDPTDWGELLIELLESVDEDDFKKASDYKKYVNKVEDLTDAYEEATTVNMISAAETAMYNLLVSTPYTTSGVDKDDFEATLYSLFFNADDLPDTYQMETAVSGNGKLNNYTYYFTKNCYSLYPIDDYYESKNYNEVYNGNEGTSDYLDDVSTDEYQWFYNVYELDVNMSC